MTQESDTAIKPLSIIKAFNTSDFMRIAVDEVPKPTETLKEIGGLYNILKAHLGALLLQECIDDKLNIKDIVSLSREISKLNEMLFVFSAKLGQLNKRDKPQDTEVIIELASHLPNRDKEKIAASIREQIKLELEDEQNGDQT